MKNRYKLAILSTPYLIFILVAGFRRPISDDESIFIYGAQQISRGDYFLDGSWDHKGPLLYWLNFIAIKIPLPNFLGIAVLQGLMISGALFFLYSKLATLNFSFRAITIASIVVDVTLISVILNLDTTEGWSLPFQIVSYSILLTQLLDSKRFERSQIFISLSGVMLGSSFALVALLRVNNGFGILLASFLIFLNLRAFKKLFIFTWAASATLILAIPLVTYFASGNLFSLISRYVSYNSDYSSGMSFSRRLFGLNYFIFNYIKSPIFILVIILLCYVIYARKMVAVPVFQILSVVGVDFFAQTLSGRGNRQYIPATVASLIILSIYLLRILISSKLTQFGLIAYSIFAAYSISTLSLDNFEASWHAGYKDQIAAAQFVHDLGANGETIYYYGPSPQSLVRSETKSISKFIYLAPVISSFSREQVQLAAELTRQVVNESPKYVLRDTNSCSFETLVCYEGNEQYMSEAKALPVLREWIIKSYERKEVKGTLEVWIRK